MFLLFFPVYMLNKKFKFLSWNIRGLGSNEKCDIVRNVIKNSRCDVVAFQETKCNTVDFSYVVRFLPSFFSKEVAFNKAINSAGGTLIAWKHSFELITSWSTKHTITVVLRHITSGHSISVTNAYGPTEDSLKPGFVSELRSCAALTDHPWLLAGDFNMVRWLVNRSSGSHSFRLMDLFNNFISDVGIVDIQLRNRSFTWSSKRPSPSFSKLDRVFTSVEWSAAYPIVMLEALEVLVSDHSPLLLTCKGIQQKKRRNRMELFWFKYQTPKVMVQRLWEHTDSKGQGTIALFQNKTSLLTRAIRLWQDETFGDIEKQLDFCKKSILFFDQIEERRNLCDHEFRFRLKIKERAYELATNIESKWKHRSRCNWLANGDTNSRFFHAHASSRLRRNLVTGIMVEGQLTTDPTQILGAFTSTMKNLLGTKQPILPFQPEALYPTNPNLEQLGTQFSLLEIELAVKQLANNKASGPDGLPNEFLKIYWNEIKHEILQIMLKFYHNNLDLQGSNLANIILIPKIETPKTTSDFRPISVLNLIPKLISKILSNRLRLVLPDLISPFQTAFVHGRQIAENFVTTRELLNHISDFGKPAIFAKIDFQKAFDSLDWEFLIRVMRARNFPERWIGWMQTLWEIASSRVCINGDESVPFLHKRGLRQGDPLSPMLFNVAVDVFQRMVHAINNSLNSPLSRKIKDSVVALQYADDTAVIANAELDTLISFKIILRLFASVSGLQVNFAKSTFIPLNVPQVDLEWLSAVVGFSRTVFPVTYLGMPLTLKRPTKQHFLPLVEKIEKRLAGW